MRHWSLPRRDIERKTCVVESAGGEFAAVPVLVADPCRVVGFVICDRTLIRDLFFLNPQIPRSLMFLRSGRRSPTAARAARLSSPRGRRTRSTTCSSWRDATSASSSGTESSNRRPTSPECSRPRSSSPSKTRAPTCSSRSEVTLSGQQQPALPLTLALLLSFSALDQGAKGAYIHSPAGTGGIEGQGQVWWEANKNDSDLDPGTLRRPYVQSSLSPAQLRMILPDRTPRFCFRATGCCGRSSTRTMCSSTDSPSTAHPTGTS